MQDSREIRKSVLKTLIYSDIFNYPLKKEEIWKFLISNQAISQNLINQTLTSHLSSGKLLFKRGFYCLRQREEIIEKRIKRERESKKKLKFAKKIISRLCLIPTVKLIGISGALSMKNSDKNDDIDLFVITSKNTLWITRLILLFFLEIFGARRKRASKNVKDKICLNFLIDEDALSFAKERQDLYNAHEIMQMRLIFERNNIYERFVFANRWVEKLLANAFGYRAGRLNKRKEGLDKGKLRAVLLSGMKHGFSIFEFFAKKFQLISIEKHRTKETVTDNFLAFYPSDCKKKILSNYYCRLKKYNLPLNY